jgi:uncharacterized protein YndB with AHSA1/START domain
VFRVEQEIRIAAPCERVWRILADHEGMPEWFPVREVILRRPGSPDPNGVGALRVARSLGVIVEERITAFKPDELLEYTITRGAPLRSYRAQVRLTPDGDGSRVRWSASFRPLLPGSGAIARRLLARLFRRGLAGLKRRAESP